MSEIKDNSYTVTLRGKDYRLLFSLNALDEIQTKFGGYDKLDEIFNKDNPNWVKETRWLLTLLINEGLLEKDENAELMEEQRVGRLIHLGNIEEVQRAILESFVKGMAGNGENNGENEEDREEAGEMKAGQEN